MPSFPPLLPTAWKIQNVGSHVEIDVVILAKLSTLPIALQQLAVVEVNNVLLEGEGRVLLSPGSLQLVTPGKGK